LQHLSTVVGLVIIAVYIGSINTESTTIVGKPSLFYWLLVGAIAGVIVLIRFLIKSSDFGLGNLVVTIISGFCIGLLALSLGRINVTK
jgi:hypothetical protein